MVQRNKRDDPAIIKDVFTSSVKELLKNNGYVLLLVSYGINVGAFVAISTLLNQFILLYFPVSKFKKFELFMIYRSNNSGPRRRRGANRSCVSIVRPRRFNNLWIYSGQDTSIQVSNTLMSIYKKNSLLFGRYFTYLIKKI